MRALYRLRFASRWVHSFWGWARSAKIASAMARQTNAAGEVVGVSVSGEKIGGDVDGATLLLPDPMGATGGSLDPQSPIARRRSVDVHDVMSPCSLTCTPECVERLLGAHDDVHIVAFDWTAA